MALFGDAKEKKPHPWSVSMVQFSDILIYAQVYRNDYVVPRVIPLVDIKVIGPTEVPDVPVALQLRSRRRSIIVAFNSDQERLTWQLVGERETLDPFPRVILGLARILVHLACGCFPIRSVPCVWGAVFLAAGEHD